MRESVLRLMFIVAITLTLQACSKEEKSEQYSYNFTVNGCATGSRSFSSLDAYCRGLADDSFNNYCASGLRCQRFQESCTQLNLNVTCN